MLRKKVYYEPEDDVLNIWVSKKHFDYAEDEDGVIIHYTKDHEPVYIEILDASRFLGKTDKSLSKKLQRNVARESFIAVPHRIK